MVSKIGLIISPLRFIILLRNFSKQEGEEIMTNSALAKELSQYPLTAITTGLLNFEQLKRQLTNSQEKNVGTDPLKIPEEERRKLFGERVKMMRNLRGLTRSEFAKKLGVSTALVSAYEVGKREPSMKNLIALTQILDIGADWLLGISPPTQEKNT